MIAYKNKCSTRWLEEIDDITTWLHDLSEIDKWMDDKDISILFYTWVNSYRFSSDS